MHFGGHDSLCLLNCLRSKTMLKQGKLSKSDSLTVGHGKLEKGIEIVMKSHGI